MSQENNTKKTRNCTRKPTGLTRRQKRRLDKDLRGVARLAKKHGAEYLSRLVREDVAARAAASA